MVFTDVDASYGNRTIRYVIKTADQVDKAGFCTSGTPDDPYGLAGADREIDILQNGFLTVLRSMTGGSGDFSYEFARYEQAPNDIQEKEIAARASKVDSADE